VLPVIILVGIVGNSVSFLVCVGTQSLKLFSLRIVREQLTI